ncbi:amino acid ABC transporter ATP-binding protein [Ferrimicrobium sp.]|uniref:amino acid ABC transporter ATP-binding protein n=1 Tax=Ferrimicrobium sp. TaxID=2926050 RepID=UPI0026344A4D|nr:amino acid ABC transporter ATP-binding protein [Ferrimicrobium sp.]
MSNDVIVDLDGVSKCFGSRVIFENVSLSVHQSEVVAIIGPSGAGKSTLIRCVNQLNTFERGVIRVFGHEIYGTEEGKPKLRRDALRELRTEIGMVFQTFNLFPHLSVLENVTLAPRRVKGLNDAEASAKAKELLSMVGLSHRVDAYPRQLSGGEQQRVAICRALAMEPKVMLFDEPTSMLDPELVGDVLEAIRRLAVSGMTMMLVTHEMHFAREVADTVVVVADGGIAEMGPAREVLTAPKSDRARNFLERVLLQTGESGKSSGHELEDALGDDSVRDSDVDGLLSGTQEEMSERESK